MLTEQELEWLERRNKPCSRCTKKEYCLIGKRHNFNIKKCSVGYPIKSPYDILCDIKNDYEDAAKFEARVALLLSVSLMSPKCGAITCCNERCEKLRATGKLDTHWCRLKAARIVIEQEMEKNKWIENSMLGI